jgi:hypothetical protein
MAPRPPLVFALVGLAWLQLSADRAVAQVLRETHLGGSATLRGETRRQTTTAPGQPARKAEEHVLQEELELRARGSVLSSRLITYALGGSFGLRQGWRDASFGGLGDDDGILYGYDATLNLLPASLVSLSLAGSRFQDRLEQSFGTDTESSGSLLGATLRVSPSALPMQLAWRRTDSEIDALGGFAPSRRSERREVIEYTAERFTSTDQVALRFRDEDVEDASLPAVGDYHVREASALLGRRFGDYLEKNLRARARWFDRSGSSDFESIAASAAFDWAVTDRFGALAQYDFNRFDADGFRTAEHTGALSLRHELYQSLRSSWSAFASDSRRDDGSRLVAGSSLSLAYRKALPRSSRLLADLRGGYRYQDNDFASATVPVRGELIVVNAFTGNALANPRVDVATIRVFQGPSGPQLSEGVDYEIDAIGDRVSINVFPGGFVSIGDTLAVDYDFAINPSAATGTVEYSVGLGCANDWLSLRYEHDRRDESLLARGPVEMLEDSTRDAVRAELTWSRPRFDLGGSIELARERTESFDLDELTLAQSLRVRVTPTLDLFAYARESWRDFRRPARNTDAISGGGGVSWRVGADGLLRLHAELRSYQDSRARDQEDVEVGATGRLRYGRFEILPSVRWTQRRRGPLDTDDLRGVLALRRHF